MNSLIPVSYTFEQFKPVTPVFYQCCLSKRSSFFARLCLLGLLAVVAATPALAQVSTGTPAMGSFTFGPDQINLGNLNAHLPIPVLSKPGRGIPFTYVLSYDSSVWTVTSTHSWQPVDNWGWRSATEMATGYLTRQTVMENCGLSPQFASGDSASSQSSPQVVTTKPRFLNFQYHDAFGVIHSGFGNTFGGCPGDGITNVYSGTDGHGYVLDTSSTPYKVTTPDGTVFNPPTGSTAAAGTKTDRNGNQITTNGSIFTDTLGLTVLTVSGGAPSPLVFTYTDSNGAPEAVTVSYTQKTIQTSFGCTGVTEFPPTAENLVSTVTLPANGGTYSFDYEATPGVAGAVTGRIHKITLPTGGAITYNYTGGTNGNGIECTDGSTAGFDRVTSDGTTSYSRSGSDPSWTTTVLDASTPRNQTTISFQKAALGAGVPNFYETQRLVNQGNPGTQLLETDTCYNGAVKPCTATTIALPITESKRYTAPGSTQPSLVDTSLNSNGLPTEVDEYDFGATPPNGLLRKTLTFYAGLSGISGLPSSIIIEDSTGAQFSDQTFTYDEGTPATTTGVPHHVAVGASRGNLTTMKQWVTPAGPSLNTTFTYDDTGNMLTSTDSFGNQTQYSYSDNFADGINRGTLAYLTRTTLPSTGTPAVQHITTTKYDASTGLTTAIADFNGKSTTYTYDGLLRPLAISTPGGGQTSFTYNTPNSTTQTRLIVGTQSVFTTTVLDGLGRLSQQQLTSDPSGTDLVDTSYDGNGMVATVSNPHRSGSSSTDGVTKFAYDALGRTILQTQPDLNTVQASYSNHCVTVTDEAGKKRENCSDALGRITSVLEPDPSNALTLETDTTYDIFNNALSITQKGGSGLTTDWRTRNFVYDNLSRLTQATAPESGTTNYNYTTSSGALCAGDPSLPCRITDARSITKTLAYDAMNRPTGKSYSDTTAPVTYKYDETNCLGQGSCFNNGFRTSMTDGSGSTAWSYDPVNRISTRKQTIGTTTNSFVYSYNPDGSVASITYPSGRTYTYGYNNAAQITSVLDVAHSINFFKNGAYAAPGMLTGGIHGQTTGWNAITLANTFNNRLQPTEIKATSPVPSTLLDLTFSYSQAGNNGSVTQIANLRDSTRSVNYTYDQLNRLSKAETVPPASTWGDSYTYDNWGNLLQKTVTKGSAENMALLVNNKNQVTTFNYDAAGNVLSDGSVSMTYDAEGHMITAAGAGFNDIYTYDGDGHRVRKSDGTLYWVDDNFHPLSIGTASGLAKDFVFMGDRRIAFVSIASGNAYYYLPDHLGSTAVIASGDGKTIQWEADYYPFGNQRRVFTSSVNNSYQFTGDEYDSDTQQDYAVARFEAGRWGRFLSPDPYLGSMDVSNPQTLNRYSYVLNDPLDLLDPLGLCGEADQVTDNPDGSTTVKGSIPCIVFGDCAMPTAVPEWSEGSDTSVISCPMPGDQGLPNVSSRPAMPQKQALPTPVKPLCITYFFKNALSNFFGGTPLVGAIGQLTGKKDLQSPIPIPGLDIAAITGTVNQLANRFDPVVVPASKALRNIGGAANLSSKQYFAAASEARLKTIGGAVTAVLADAALGQALFNEINAFENGQCRAIGD